jgi:hypothetical protein
MLSVLVHCEEKIDLEASRCCEFKLIMSEPNPIDPDNGLADWSLGKDWR